MGRVPTRPRIEGLTAMRLEDIYLTMQAFLATFAVLNVLFWRTLHPTVGARRASPSSSPSLPSIRPPRISLLIPARNEALNLERLLPSLLQNDDPTRDSDAE
ncbi:MAG: hypothetical protein HC933_20875 [Pleurocapsa sp. SU_196_0]|nr:hypothetical protein [Pleurocapsa sp. SU_196_0]